ncbi:CamS family sex pheromone protein [Lentibacillus cibarius]|uniref:CamS family sex pheromone protein n=1 Tax=Lentibacillus cibarius TaxID=2583219 RepID=UPI001F1FDC4D|nr:CamS family sex pheromone protein [Lentibacillus cibarius]
MLKKVLLWLAITLLILSGCAPSLNNNEDEVVEKENDTKQPEKSIVPSYQLSDENYRTILPYRTSSSRGVITNQVMNRMDIGEMETGLRRLSKAYYDPEKYFFEEGQYLTSDMLYKWLDRNLTKDQVEDALNKRVEQIEKSGKEVDEEDKEAIRKELQLGLNPAIADDESKKQQKENPKYLTHILEHNFLKKNEDNTVELIGASIGIAMKSDYAFQTEIGGPTYHKKIDKKTMLKKGKQITQTVLERVRKIDGMSDIPIMFALYREEEQGSPVPGSYVAKTQVSGGDMTIGDWETVNEENILFPSDEGEKKYYDQQQLINDFSNKIQEYFPNYVGVIGEGFYVNEELQKLTLEIPLEFFGKGEVIGFTQYTYGLIQEMFQNYYELEVKIKTNKQMESVIYRDAGDKDPVVHIFDK